TNGLGLFGDRALKGIGRFVGPFLAGVEKAQSIRTSATEVVDSAESSFQRGMNKAKAKLDAKSEKISKATKA
ncbi:MAG: hypothetical protein AAFN92_16985, partial [Bacteroidota bacterium]